MSLYVEIAKRFGDFNLQVKFETSDNFTSLFGLSGSGKSLTLKSIAGLITPDEGVIILNDRVLFDSNKRINIKPQDRHIGYLPQDFSLFPNMSVKENIITGLHSLTKNQRNTVAQEYIERFKLCDVSDLRPNQISGGQKQRTALARALATKPEIILLDEPFSSLDAQLKETLELDLMSTLRNYNGDVLFVSHNSDEVYRLSDNVCVFDSGVCDTIKPTVDVFKKPNNKIEAVLVGIDNISDCERICDNKYRSDFGFVVESACDITSIAFSCDAVKIGSNADIVFDVIVEHMYSDTSGTYLLFKTIERAKMIKMLIEDCDHNINDRITVGLNYSDLLYLK